MAIRQKIYHSFNDDGQIVAIRADQWNDRATVTETVDARAMLKIKPTNLDKLRRVS